MIISILGEVNRHTCHQISALDPYDDLVVLINCCGGYLSDAFILARAIKAHKGPVTTRAIRQCNSASLLIFAAGHTREAKSDTRFVFHSTAFRTGEQITGRLTAATLRQRAASLERQDNYCRDFIHECTGVDTAILARLEAGDASIDAIEAHRIGLVNRVTDRPNLSRPQHNLAPAGGFDNMRLPQIKWTTRECMALLRSGYANRPLGIDPQRLRELLNR